MSRLCVCDALRTNVSAEGSDFPAKILSINFPGNAGPLKLISVRFALNVATRISGHAGQALKLTRGDAESRLPLFQSFFSLLVFQQSFRSLLVLVVVVIPLVPVLDY
jgi:hypothetical protein